MSRPAIDPPPGGAPQEPPFFSVLIATYNHARFLRETLGSVAAQTFASWELIVVNDGSKDDTEAVLCEWGEELARTHANRFVPVTVPNGGQMTALERGFSLATGRWIGLLDSDDRWLPEKLARVHEAARRHPEAGLIVHPVHVVGPEGHRTGDLRPKRAALSSGNLRETIRRTGRVVSAVTSGVILRADVFAALLPSPLGDFPSAADAYLTLGASLAAPVHAIDEPLAEYRMHPQGDYIRSMLSPAGLRHWNERQLAIMRHFDLEHLAARNAWFARNAFAVAKLEGSTREQVRTYRALVRATATDTAFSLRDRATLLAFWSACMAAPRSLFARMWRLFQTQHTGGIAPPAEVQ